MSLDVITLLAMIINNIVGVLLYFYFFDGILERKEQSKRKHIYVLIIVSVILIILNSTITNPNIFALVTLVIYSGIVMYSFEGNRIIRLMSGLFFVIFGVVVELLTALLMSISLSISIFEITENTGLYIVGSILSKLMMLFIIKMILKFTHKKVNSVANKYWIYMLTIPIVSIYIILTIVHTNTMTGSNQVTSFWSAVAALYINIVSFFLFDIILRKVEENSEYQFANQQLSMQQEHYHNIIEGHTVTRGLWHDMKNNLIAIHTFLDHNDVESAIGAVEHMNEELRDTAKAIHSGNMVVDALINNKLNYAKIKDIDFKMEFDIPNVLKINSLDLCMILGNALDNAIEACTRIQDSTVKKLIEIKLVYRQSSLIISLTNPYDTSTIYRNKGKFLSSKHKLQILPNNQWHGYGLFNMEKAVHIHSGNMIISTENSRFSLNIIIPI